MTREETLLRRLAAEVTAELASLEQLAQELAGAPSGADTYSLRALGSILHDFYSGVERIFVRIAGELNGGVPQAERWHRELLGDMVLEIPKVRPAVIDADLATALGEYLRFRHLFRNVYGSGLEAERLQALADRLPATLAAFGERIQRVSLVDARRRSRLIARITADRSPASKQLVQGDHDRDPGGDHRAEPHGHALLQLVHVASQ